MIPPSLSFFSTSPHPHGGSLGSNNSSLLAGPHMYNVQIPSASSSLPGTAQLTPSCLFSPQRSAGGDDKETPMNDKSTDHPHEVDALFLMEKGKTPFSLPSSPEDSNVNTGGGFTVLADVGSTTASPQIAAATTAVTYFSDASGAADRSCSQPSMNSGGRRGGGASMTNPLTTHRHMQNHPPVRGAGRETKANCSGPMGYPNNTNATTTTTNPFANSNPLQHPYSASQQHPRRGDTGERRGAPVVQAPRSASNTRHSYAHHNGHNNAAGCHLTSVESSRDRRLHLDFKALTKSERQRVVQREAADSDLLERTVHLRFLPTSMKQGELAAMCGECGPFLRIRICGNSTDSQNWIYGFVEFETREGAMRLMRMNGREMPNGEGKAVLRLKCHTANQPIVDRVFHDADPASNSPCIFGQGNFEHRTLKDALDSYFNLKAKEQRGQQTTTTVGCGRNSNSLTGSLHTLDTTTSSVTATTMTMTTNSGSTSVNNTPTRRTTPTLTGHGIAESNIFSVVGGNVDSFGEGGGMLTDPMGFGIPPVGTGGGCPTAIVHPSSGGGTLPLGMEAGAGTMLPSDFLFLPTASRPSNGGSPYPLLPPPPPPPTHTNTNTNTTLFPGFMGGIKEGVGNGSTLGSDGTGGGMAHGMPTGVPALSSTPVPAGVGVLGATRHSQLRATAQAFIPPFPLASSVPGGSVRGGNASHAGASPHPCLLPLGMTSGTGNGSVVVGGGAMTTTATTEMTVPHFSVSSASSPSAPTPETTTGPAKEAPAGVPAEATSDPKEKSPSTSTEEPPYGLPVLVTIDQAGLDWMPPLGNGLFPSLPSTPSLEGEDEKGGAVPKASAPRAVHPFSKKEGRRGVVNAEKTTGAAADKTPTTTTTTTTTTTVLRVVSSALASSPSSSATSRSVASVKPSFTVPSSSSSSSSPAVPLSLPLPLPAAPSLPAFSANPFSPFLFPISTTTTTTTTAPAEDATPSLPRRDGHATGTLQVPLASPAATVSQKVREEEAMVAMSPPLPAHKQTDARLAASAEVVLAFSPPSSTSSSSSSHSSSSPFVSSPFQPLTVTSQESVLGTNVWHDKGPLFPSSSVLPLTAPNVVVLPPPSPKPPVVAAAAVKEEVDAKLSRVLESMVSNNILAVSGEEVVLFCAGLLRKAFQQGKVYRHSPQHFQEIIHSLRHVLEKLDMYEPLTGSAADTTAGDWTSELPQKATQLRLLTNLAIALFYLAKRSLRDALPFIHALVRCTMAIPSQSLHPPSEDALGFTTSTAPPPPPNFFTHGADDVPVEEDDEMDKKDLWIERSAGALLDEGVRCNTINRYDSYTDADLLDDEGVTERPLFLHAEEDEEEEATCPLSSRLGVIAHTDEWWGRRMEEEEEEEREEGAQGTPDAAGNTFSLLDDARETCAAENPLAVFHTRDLQFHRYVLHLLLCAGISVEEMMPELACRIFEFTLSQAENILHQSNEAVRLCVQSIQQLSLPSPDDGGASVLAGPQANASAGFASLYRKPIRSAGYYRLGDEVMYPTGHHSGSGGMTVHGGFSNGQRQSGGGLTGAESPFGRGGGAVTEAGGEKVPCIGSVDPFSIPPRGGGANGAGVVGATITVTAGNDILHSGGGAAPTRDVTAFPRFFFQHASTCTSFLTLPMENSEFWASLPPMLFMKHFF